MFIHGYKTRHVIWNWGCILAHKVTFFEILSSYKRTRVSTRLNEFILQDHSFNSHGNNTNLVIILKLGWEFFEFIAVSMKKVIHKNIWPKVFVYNAFHHCSEMRTLKHNIFSRTHLYFQKWFLYLENIQMLVTGH